MDVRMPGLDGIEATRQIKNDDDTAGIKVLILTTFDLDEYVYAGLRAGASGFMLKDTSPEQLLEAIRVVASGEALLAPNLLWSLRPRWTPSPSGSGKSCTKWPGGTPTPRSRSACT
jgi:DNA-binding NarL/FixJ family response regulator